MEFRPFPKIPRLVRTVIITEKIDGTNAVIEIGEDYSIRAGSRCRWLTRDFDNFGFCRWVDENRTALKQLGPGIHYGEWWGSGIQRGYGLKERRLSLFRAPRYMTEKPDCVRFVPQLAECLLTTENVDRVLQELKENGSSAAPGYMNPEGIIIFHKDSGQLFKKTYDDNPKGNQ